MLGRLRLLGCGGRGGRSSSSIVDRIIQRPFDQSNSCFVQFITQTSAQSTSPPIADNEPHCPPCAEPASSINISFVAPIFPLSEYSAAIKLPSTPGNSRCNSSTSRSCWLWFPDLFISNCCIASRCSPRSFSGMKSVSLKVSERGSAPGCWPPCCPGGGPGGAA